MKDMFLKKSDIYYSKWATVIQKFQLSMTKLGNHDEIRWFDGIVQYRTEYRTVYNWANRDVNVLSSSLLPIFLVTVTRAKLNQIIFQQKEKQNIVVNPRIWMRNDIQFGQ